MGICCTFRKIGSMRRSMAISMEPIGVVRSECKTPDDLPKGSCAGVPATLVIDPRFEEGLADIAAGDRLMVVFYFHLSREAKLTVPLKGVGPLVGVFSSHSPTRPNFIGITEVEVERIDGLRIAVTGADMLDGTPVLDLKPAPHRN